jgi:hypothetical protein
MSAHSFQPLGARPQFAAKVRIRVLVLAVALGLISLFSPRLPAQEQKAAAVPSEKNSKEQSAGQTPPAFPKPGVVPESAFRAVLPDGAVIELVGLCEHPTAGRDWWRPDGSPLGKIPAGEAPKELPPNGFGIRVGNPGFLDRDLAIDATLREGAEITLVGLRTEQHSSANTFKKTDDKKMVQSLRALVQFLPNSRVRLSLHYAPEPWKSYGQSKNWLTLRNGQRVRSAGVLAFQGSSFGVIIMPPTEEKETHGPPSVASWTTISAAYDFEDNRHREVRFVAVDAAGREHFAKIKLTPHARGASLLMARFPNLPLESVELFRFESRPFQMVQFRDVSLHPGQKTNFEVRVGDVPVEPVAPHSPRRGRGQPKTTGPQ